VTATRAAPISIWAVSDGRAGIEGQVVGLAEAAARLRPAEISVKRVAWRGGTGKLPWQVHPLPRLTLSPEAGIAPPWPDLWIAAGRATLPLSIRMRRWSQGRSFVVQVQDPRIDPSRFDLVIPPRHDDISGPNVFPITGSPHGVTPEKLAEAKAHFAGLLEPLPSPRVAVLIGGASKVYELPSERAAALARQIGQSITEAGGSLMMTFSRRTPLPARTQMTARLRDVPGVIWDDVGENPYFGFLAWADHILVTEDSTNMATQAAATGKPVHLLAMDGGSAKFRRLHDELETLGAARPFSGMLEDWSYRPLAETERAAAETLRRFDQAPRVAA
jgi:mitochondrial fission protein ELM1